MSRCWIDIETDGYPDPEILEMLKAGIKPRSNIKDPAKIAKDIADKEAKLMDKAALDPMLGRIVCIGVMYRAPKTGDWIQKSFLSPTPGEEGPMLMDFGAWARVTGITEWAGFNLREFDLPFIAIRAAHLGIEMQTRLPLGKWDKSVVELRDWLREGGLDKWARFLGVGGKTGHGASVAGLVKEGKFAKISEYCLNDVQITKDVYDRLGLSAQLTERRRDVTTEKKSG